MRTTLVSGSAGMLVLALALGGCGKAQPERPVEKARVRAEAKRYRDACASPAAYDHLKRAIFSQAGRAASGHQTNLNTLEAFAFVRMEDPVVEGFDPALDITRCRGRFVLDVPPGSARAFGGEHRLQADITYTAQRAADASGLVYVIRGAEPIVGKLAMFDLSDASYRPLPAVDAGARPDNAADVAASTNATDVVRQPRQVSASAAPAGANIDRTTRTASATPILPRRVPAQEQAAVAYAAPDQGDGAGAEAIVRTFYGALGAGNGQVASAQVVPAKRSSRAYSPDAISRFYGRLSEPLRLTGVTAVSDDTFRVTYRYAGPGIRCIGSAVVRLTPSSTQPLIRSISADRGC